MMITLIILDHHVHKLIYLELTSEIRLNLEIPIDCTFVKHLATDKNGKVQKRNHGFPITTRQKALRLSESPFSSGSVWKNTFRVFLYEVSFTESSGQTSAVHTKGMVKINAFTESRTKLHAEPFSRSFLFVCPCFKKEIVIVFCNQQLWYVRKNIAWILLNQFVDFGQNCFRESFISRVDCDKPSWDCLQN